MTNIEINTNNLEQGISIIREAVLRSGEIRVSFEENAQQATIEKRISLFKQIQEESSGAKILKNIDEIANQSNL
jgi:hypothetical protein